MSLLTEAAYQHTFAATAILGVLAAVVPLTLRSARRHHRPAHAK